MVYTLQYLYNRLMDCQHFSMVPIIFICSYDVILILLIHYLSHMIHGGPQRKFRSCFILIDAIRCHAEGHRCHTKLPLFIVTSDDTHALTINLLESNSYFWNGTISSEKTKAGYF